MRTDENDANERFLRLGTTALTELELFAVLLGPRAAGRARQALRKTSLRELLTGPPETLVEQHRLSLKNAARLTAAVELVHRADRIPEARPQLITPQAIAAWARGRLPRGKREEFHVLCLDSRHVLLRHVRIAEGSVDQCHVDPREVFAPAVAARATGIVLLHNHPSGDTEPSVHDVALTRQLAEGARLLCINVVDHLVLGNPGYTSFRARGLLDGSGRRRLVAVSKGADTRSRR